MAYPVWVRHFLSGEHECGFVWGLHTLDFQTEVTVLRGISFNGEAPIL